MFTFQVWVQQSKDSRINDNQSIDSNKQDLKKKFWNHLIDCCNMIMLNGWRQIDGLQLYNSTTDNKKCYLASIRQSKTIVERETASHSTTWFTNFDCSNVLIVAIKFWWT